MAGANTSNPESVRVLGRAMVDYWLSFAVSLTPNDGKGTASTCLLRSPRAFVALLTCVVFYRDRVATIHVREACEDDDSYFANAPADTMRSSLSVSTPLRSGMRHSLSSGTFPTHSATDRSPLLMPPRRTSESEGEGSVRGL